jgi:hypothetical protein
MATQDLPSLRTSTWSSRIALFSLALVALGILLHRVLGLPTPVLLNLLAVGLGGGIAAILLALAAFAIIWRSGRPGAAAALLGLVVGAGLAAWPLAYLPAMRSLPQINDVTTDPQSPPRFLAIARLRANGTNVPTYPGAAFARLQAAAYPDIKPFMVDRSAEEAFELALEAVRRQRMAVLTEEPPGGRLGRQGLIEAVDRTLIVGFYDDVAIRIDGDARSARIDLRSASRHGRHDLGGNAQRLRRLMREIEARLEATVPTASGERVSRRRDRLIQRVAVPKRGQEADPASTGRPPARDRARSDAQRGPQPKPTPRGPDDRQSRDTRPQQQR